MSPSLTPEDQEQMLGGEHRCVDCGHVTSKNYCRQCDEFYYEGHATDCPRMDPARPYSEDHRGHRTY
jgi:hypothetical protein